MPSATGRFSRSGAGTRTGSSRVPNVTPLPTADVHVAVTGTAHRISRLQTALSWVNNPNTWREAGWPNVRTNITAMLGAQSTHLNPFGNAVPWEWNGTGTKSTTPNNLWGETTWNGVKGVSASTNSFVGGLGFMRQASGSGPLHVKMFMPTWWMKEDIALDGSATDLTYADKDDAAKGRLKYSAIGEWQLLVTEAAKVAMSAPYNVRYFSVHNELKGFWGGYITPTAKWDVTFNDGSVPGTPMGYSYFYKITCDAILSAATALSIPTASIKLGGPYCTVRGRGTDTSSIATNHPYASVLRGRSWGWVDRQGVWALESFLDEVVAHSLRLDFLSVDGADYNTDNTYPASDDWVHGTRWADWHTWLRGTLVDHGFSADLPIVWDEFYRYPVKNTSPTNQFRAALKADFLRQCALDGVLWPMAWGPEGSSFESGGGGMLTDASTASGGTPLPFGDVCALLTTHFPAGTTLYDVTIDDPNKVAVLASNTKALLVNKTNALLNVDVNLTVHSLTAYEVKVVSL